MFIPDAGWHSAGVSLSRVPAAAASFQFTTYGSRVRK
jgi:hypothetical protein